MSGGACQGVRVRRCVSRGACQEVRVRRCVSGGACVASHCSCMSTSGINKGGLSTEGTFKKNYFIL